MKICGINTIDNDDDDNDDDEDYDDDDDDVYRGSFSPARSNDGVDGKAKLGSVLCCRDACLLNIVKLMIIMMIMMIIIIMMIMMIIIIMTHHYDDHDDKTCAREAESRGWWGCWPC